MILFDVPDEKADSAWKSRSKETIITCDVHSIGTMHRS